MKKQTVILSKMLLLGVLVLSCAKERPYEEVEGKPIEAFNRSTISTDGQQTQLDENGKSTDKLVMGKTKYLYMKSTHGAPRKVVEADPFYQGQQKLVQIEWTKDGLLLSEIEPESKFQHVPENFNPVILIPGKYLSYRCTTDANGQCQNKEEEDPSVDWTKKPYFVPDFAAIKNIEVNDLDLFGVEGMFSSGCVNAVHSVVTNYEVSGDGINIEIEQFYKVANRIECVIDQFFKDQTGSLGFRMKYMYSIVRLDRLASPDYETVQYPVPDHDHFGFFTTEMRTLKDDNNPNTKARNYFLQRFNPKKKVIPYYLSDSFNRPENASIKKASYEAVDSINESLRRADAGIQIELKEPAGKMPGDLRNNMLVLIDQYLDNNLLGYGPSVPNPLTGEIVQAHVNMYSGVLRSMTRRVWAEMVEVSKEEVKVQKAQEPAKEKEGHASQELANSITSQQLLAKSHASHLMAFNNTKLNLAELKTKKLKVNTSALEIEKKLFKERANTKVDLKTHIAKLGDDGVTEEYRVALEKMSEQNMYHTEFFNVGGTAKTLFPGVKELSGVLNADGTLKEYNELSQEQRKEAADLIIVHTYRTTLIHEFGHNLGLRHNFTGSFDKDNFYKEEDLKDLGLRSVPAYSSIMDYGASELNELSVFGKYDVAALRYGYARQVELVDPLDATKVIGNADISEIGSITAFEKSNAATPRKNYLFCTDGNAGLNTPCNRFDEGTSLVEITKSHIATYKQRYKSVNLRDERLDFIDMDVDTYAARIIRSFKEIRNVYEDLEFYVGFMDRVFAGNPPDVMVQIKAYAAVNGCLPQLLAVPAYKSFCDRFKDAADATKLAATFFVDIIKSPDLTCFTEEKDEENKTVAGSFKLGKQFMDDLRFDDSFETSAPYTCFDPRVVKLTAENGQTIVAENGVILNDLKDPNPEFKYSNDIYVRGNWADKLIATKYLTYRRSDRLTTDDTYGALIDLPYVKEDMINVFAHMAGVDDNLVNPVAATLADGTKKVIDYQLTTEDKIPEVSYYLGRFKRVFGLGNSDTSLNGQLFTVAQMSNTFTIPNLNDYRQIRDLLEVQRTSVSDYVKSEFLPQTIGNNQYYALSSNILAKATLGTLMLSEVKGDKTQEMLAKKALETRKAIPIELTLEEAKLYVLENSLLNQAYLIATKQAQMPPEAVILTVLGDEVGAIFIYAATMDPSALENLLALKEETENKVPSKSEVADDLKALYQDYSRYFVVPLNELEASISEKGISEDKVKKSLEALEYIYN